MINEAGVSEVLRSRGVFANRSWVNQSIAYLRKQGGVINSAEAMAEKVFNLFLLSDIYDSCDYVSDTSGGRSQGLLPPNLISKHAEIIAQNEVIILQIDEVTNIGSSLDRQMQEGNRYLKLFLTDGVNCAVGLEHRKIDDLSVNIPAGTKICIKNVPVRRGALMLSPCCFKVLGGEVGRLTELAKLYAPVEEVKSHILDQRHAVKPPSVNASINTQHQQIVSNCLPRPQGQHQSQQLSEKKRQPAPSLPAQAAGLAIPEKSNDQDEGDIDSFAYSDAIELLGSPDLEHPPVGSPPSEGLPQRVHDLTASGLGGSPVEIGKSPITILDTDEPIVVEHSSAKGMARPLSYSAVDQKEENDDDLLATPPNSQHSPSDASVKALSVLPHSKVVAQTLLPEIPPLSRLVECVGLPEDNKQVFIRGHGVSMEKFKLRKAKDTDKSQSPAKDRYEQPEFEIYLHFDDGSAVYKLLRVHPRLCEVQAGCSAQAYQENMESLDAQGASEYKRAIQMKFAAFRGVFRCEWKKPVKRKKKKAGFGTPDALELVAIEDVTNDPEVIRALTRAGMREQ